MPIYEYRCESCGRYHQQLVLSLASYQVPACPRCGQETLRKLVSRFAVKRSEDSRLDYVRAMRLILRQDQPDDYVIGTGQTHSIGELVELAFGHVGLEWQRYVELD